MHEIEDFFHSKKRSTLDAIGREPSEAVVDIYIKGFLRQVHERLMQICPELMEIDESGMRRGGYNGPAHSGYRPSNLSYA